MFKYLLGFAFLSLALTTTALAQTTITRTITFPVSGTHSFRDDFSEPRAGGAREHLGIDIIASKMTPVVAAVDGRISYLASPQASWGYSITLRDAEGYQYRYLHLNNDTPGTDDGAGGEANAYAAGLRRGSEVTRGQIIGWVGDSGNAEETVSHLHFEIRSPDRTSINPYATLKTADTSGSAAPATTTPTQTETESDGNYVFTKPLSVGSHGEDVRQLQLLLKDLGYFDYPEATGYFGSVTKAAVIAFQKAQNIDPIGIVGPLTRGVLNGI